MLSSADTIVPHEGFKLPLAARIACGGQESFLNKTLPLSLIVVPYADSSQFSYSYCMNLPSPRLILLGSLRQFASYFKFLQMMQITDCEIRV